MIRQYWITEIAVQFSFIMICKNDSVMFFGVLDFMKFGYKRIYLYSSPNSLKDEIHVFKIYLYLKGRERNRERKRERKTERKFPSTSGSLPKYLNS